MRKKATPEQITRYADMFAAMGTDSRLRIVQLLLSAHPDGMVAGEIQAELEISASNLSHHPDATAKRRCNRVIRLARVRANLGWSVICINPAWSSEAELLLDLVLPGSSAERAAG